MGLLRSLVGQIDRLASDLTTLVTQARDSRSSLHRNAGPLFEVFCTLVDENDIPKDASLPPLCQ